MGPTKTTALSVSIRIGSIGESRRARGEREPRRAALS